ncbi:MAG: hypothetical protein ACRCYP_01540 [Alphaproteobacteria bacterium]
MDGVIERRFEVKAKDEYTRGRLIEICEKAVVPVEKWSNRDTPSAQEKIGLCWILLKDGCEFRVIVGSSDPKDNCVTNEDTIWLKIRWPSFDDIEWGDKGNCSNEELFYLPTEARLHRREGRDWY